MTDRTTPTERLTAFSDGVFSVIITIMVLDLKPPAQANLSALLPLWPTALSYAVNYLFVATSGSIIIVSCFLRMMPYRSLYGGILGICS